VVRTASRVAATLVLAQVGEARDAATELEGLELSFMPVEMRCWLALGLAARDIKVPPGMVESGYPELPSQLFGCREQELNGQLFSLYDRLRVFLLRDKTGYPWLEARSSSLGEPVKTLVHTVGLLANIWGSYVQDRGNTASRLPRLKEVAVGLDL